MSRRDVSSQQGSPPTRLKNLRAADWVFVAALAVYVVCVSAIQLDTHRGLGTSSYDIGLYDQGVWLLSRFESPFVTLMGRNLLGDHASLILFLVVPFYWIVPGSETLIVLQTVVIAAGAVPIYLFARRHLTSSWTAFALAACWFINPSVVFTNFENFHPDAFLGLFIPLALYGALERRWRPYAAGVVLAMLVKEDAMLILVPLGVYVALGRERRIGVMTVLASIAGGVAGMFLLMKPLIGVPTRNGWRIPFGGPWGLVRTAVTDPLEFWRYVRSEGRLYYLWQLGAPFAFLFFAAPEVAAISILVVLSNIISTFWYQFHIQYHYTLVIVPALAFATILAVGKARERWRGALASLVVGCTVAATVLWGPWWFSARPVYRWNSDHPVAVAAREIMREVPDGESLSVYHSLAPHLAHRREVYQFPNPFRVVLYGTDISLEGSRLPSAETVRWVLLPKSLDEQLSADWAREEAAFTLVTENEWFRLFERSDAGQTRTSGVP